MTTSKGELPIGKKFISEGRTITEGEFALLHDLTWIVGSVHANREYMKTTQFGERLLGGPIVLSLIYGLRAADSIHEAIERTGHRIVALLGFDNVRFKASIHPGDTMHSEREIIAANPTSKAGRVVIQMKDVGIKQNGDVVIESISSWLYEKVS